ncbi:MAG: GNAT family N-acetyltransferase [Planctomycetaceae bacterium]|nr:GNAT family N-acetyltransferase [Planctomycetaceae bacterium]
MMEQATVDLLWARQHVELLERIRAFDPAMLIPTLASVERSMLRAKFARQVGFRYEEENGIAIQLIARVSPTLRDTGQRPLGMIGFFAALPAQAATIRTLHAAVRWLEQQGCQTIIGPMDGDTWHRYRFNIGPPAEPPFLLEPTNPSYYPSAWEAAGFHVVETYHSKQVVDLPAVARLTEPAEQRALGLGYRFRPFDAGNFESELRRVYDLSVAAFRDNLYYDDLEWDEFLELYAPSRPLLNERLVWFALDSQDQPVGFLFCLINYVRAVQVMNHSRSVWAKLKFLWSRRYADAVNFKSIAVLPEHRRASLGAALMHQGYRESFRLGYRKANLCLIHDDNPSSKLDQARSTLLRRYALYQYGKNTEGHRHV